MADSPSKLPPRLIIGVGGVLLFILVLHLAGVAVLRYVVERELHPALPKGTYIGDVHVNLFTGALEVDDFELRNAGKVRMRFGRLVLRVSPWHLLFGSVRVDEAMLRRGYVRVDRREDGSFDLGLPDFGDGSAPADTEPPDVRLLGARVEHLMVDYHDGDLASNLYVDLLKVGAYSLQADSQRLPLEWQLQWDQRRIAGDAVVTLASDGIAAEGQLQTDLLDLRRAERLARLPPTVDGEVGLQGRFAWSAPKLSLSGDLQVPRLAYAFAERSIVLSGVEFPGFRLDVLTAPGIVVEFVPGAGSRAASWETELEGQRVNGEAISLSGRVRYDGSGTIDTSDLALGAESVGWSDAGRRLQITGLRIDGRAQQSLTGETPFPALNADLAAGSVEYDDQPAALSVRLSDLQLKDLALSPLSDTKVRQLGGRLSIAASEVTQAETVLAWASVDITLGGQVGPATLQLVTDAAVSGLRVDNPLLAHGPLTLGGITASGLELGEAVRFDSLGLAQLALPGEPRDTSLQVASIRIGESRYSAGQGVALGQIVIDGLQTAVIRDKAGQWRYPMSSPAGPAQGGVDGSADAGQGTDTSTLPWRLAGLQVGGDSYLKTADLLNPDMLAPRFRIEKLEIGALASDAPQRNTKFEVVLRPDEYSEFAISGEVRPLAPDLYLEAKGWLHGFAMQAFNGLIADDLGHRFVEGQLDNDFAISIERNRLTMSNDLALATVDAEAIPGKEGPPLATAIALLEDRDGNIKLDVPVEGDLTDPNFRVLGALNPIIMKAVAGTAALAIQPLGSVLLVGSLLADQALKVTFQPAPFDAGSTELNAAARKYLDQLAAKLGEKPKLRVRVCGVAVDAERKKDKQGKYADRPEDLLAVAQSRADAVKAYMQGKGATDKQLRRCRPALDPTPDADPRVDIKF